MKLLSACLACLFLACASVAETVRWEYATYGSSFDGMARKSEVTWASGREIITAPSLELIADKLVEAKVIAAKPAKATTPALFDALGDKGWEFVQRDGWVNPSGSADTYRFKRRKD